MERHNMDTREPEMIVVETTHVSCDGGHLGHPKVYLEIGSDGEVTCPYCSRRFVLKSKVTQS